MQVWLHHCKGKFSFLIQVCSARAELYLSRAERALESPPSDLCLCWWSSSLAELPVDAERTGLTFQWAHCDLQVLPWLTSASRRPTGERRVAVIGPSVARALGCSDTRKTTCSFFPVLSSSSSWLTTSIVISLSKKSLATAPIIPSD